MLPCLRAPRRHDVLCAAPPFHGRVIPCKTNDLITSQHHTTPHHTNATKTKQNETKHNVNSILVLALMFSTGLLLQLLGCVLYRNWWPMLTGVMYVLVPMPYLFFGAGAGGADYYGGSAIASGWVDAGKFLTGFSAVGSVAIPAILAHASVITTGALVLELAAVAVLGATFVVYDYHASRDAGGY